MPRVGGIDQKAIREFNAPFLTPIQVMTPEKIRALRTREQASQTVLAAYQRHSPPGQQKGKWGKAPSTSVSKAAFPRGQEGAGSRCLIVSTTLKRWLQ